MGLDNPLHIAFLVVILLLVFGARRLPEIGRSLGSGMREFKDSISGETNNSQAPQPTISQAAPQQPMAPPPPVAQPQPVAQQPQPVAQPVVAPQPQQTQPQESQQQAAEAFGSPPPPQPAPAEPTRQA
jgi:sec-independent protein translocase protein TatA